MIGKVQLYKSLLLERFFRTISSNKSIFSVLWKTTGFFERRYLSKIDITSNTRNNNSVVEKYWNEHTVIASTFSSKIQSRLFLKWRRSLYPLFDKMMGLDKSHEGKVLLDYGCGPGNDLIEFSYNAKATKIYGLDISHKALELAKNRLELHNIENSKIELIQINDSNSQIPLNDESIDFINCTGVLMHTSEPLQILTEFFRILKSGGHMRIMIYNRNSIWYHLFVPYVIKILENKNSELSDNDVFKKSTDGEDCPLARSYSDEEFIRLIQPIGFDVNYLGGYLSLHELKILYRYITDALNDMRLPDIHKVFLRNLTFDKNGKPQYMGKYAGIGGVYEVTKN